MSNIEGEIMMGEGAIEADAGIVRGPRGQAADLIQEMKLIRAQCDEFSTQNNGKEMGQDLMIKMNKLLRAYNDKRDQALTFLLDQVGK